MDATPCRRLWIFFSRRPCCANSISEKARWMASPLSPGMASLSSRSMSILRSGGNWLKMYLYDEL